MIKLIAMLIAYKLAWKVLRDEQKMGTVGSVEEGRKIWAYNYNWMYRTLMGPVLGKGKQ